MTNEQKYKTTDERMRAFWRFCKGQEKKNGCLGCPTKGVPPYREKCALTWLALKAEEDKPLPCPFCDYPSPYLHNDGERWLVDCGACGAQIFRATRESAIAAWNGRAK